jgi:hypothetical protein
MGRAIRSKLLTIPSQLFPNFLTALQKLNVKMLPLKMGNSLERFIAASVKITSMYAIPIVTRWKIAARRMSNLQLLTRTTM